MRSLYRALLATLLLAAASPAAQPGKAVLSQVRYASTESRTRVTLELSSEVRYETHALQGDPSKNLPPRIYLDLVGARLGAEAKQPISTPNGFLLRVRTAQYSADVVRVVLDVARAGEYRASLLSDPYRIVVDIEARDGGEKTVPPEKKEPIAPAKAVKPALPALRKIVIDPGHGGKDPGAIGVGGIAEKDIVLAVAKKLAMKLKKEMGVEVVLTRAGDSFVELKDRTALANAEQADLFISLHVNASPNPDAKGIETYYLDNTTDEAANRLAARENSVGRGGVTDIQFILSDMIQNLKLEDSITLANRLHGSVVSQVGRRYGEVRDLGVKKALFYVLVGARMPSVLVELFFVTNKSDARALAQEGYQDALADALFGGIKKYQESLQVVKNL